MLKAKTIAVLGNTLEAYSTAANIRKYLERIGQT